MEEKSTLSDNVDLVPNGEIELTNEQWDKVKALWNSRPNNPPSLMELTRAAFDKDNLDGRTKEGRAVRRKLTESKMGFSTSKYTASGLLTLTDTQKEYIRNNYKTMKGVEMARVLYNNNSLTNLNQETRTVLDYMKSLDKKDSFEDPNEISSGKYNPPKQTIHALARVNKYTNQNLQEATLTGKQKKDVAALISFLCTYRFQRQINTYEKIEDRELFESSFIRYTYDKHDLTEEEVDQYIVLSTEVVIGATIQARTETLRRLLDEAADGDDDGSSPKISMALVEAINTAQTEYNQCVLRQQKLLESLKVKRSEKEGKSKTGHASVLNLIQAWKDEESRKKMIKLAELQRDKLKQGVEEFVTIDELKAKVYGLSIDEALYG